MNTKYLLFLTAGLIAFYLQQLRSQTLVDTNKLWNVSTCQNFGGCVTISYKFNGDTIIGTHEYKKLLYTSDSSLKTNWYYYGAMREELSKKIYFHDLQNQNEYLLYDFGLNKKDTLTTNFNGCKIQMVVDSIDTVKLLNGELQKRLFMKNVEVGYGGIWIEGIGSLNGLVYSQYYCAVDIWDGLICFTENNILKYRDSGYNSCYINTTDIHEIKHKKNSILVFPNPFTNNIYITSNEIAGSIDIFSIDGMKVYSETFLTPHLLDNFKLSLTGIEKGIYFIKINNNLNEIGYGKIIKVH